MAHECHLAFASCRWQYSNKNSGKEIRRGLHLRCGTPLEAADADEEITLAALRESAADKLESELAVRLSLLLREPVARPVDSEEPVRVIWPLYIFLLLPDSALPVRESLPMAARRGLPPAPAASCDESLEAVRESLEPS